MGYSHYLYYYPDKITDEQRHKFKSLASDVVKKARERGISIHHVWEDNFITINGTDNQALNKRVYHGEQSLQRPDEEVRLIKEGIGSVTGEWFAGTLVNYPMCPINMERTAGNGSYETLVIDRKPEHISDRVQEKYGKGIHFDSCKTNYYPYDVAVTAILLLLKEICPDCIYYIYSDGEKKDRVLGYLLLKEATNIKAKEIHFG